MSNEITLEEVEAYADMAERLAALKEDEMRVRKELAEKIFNHCVAQGEAQDSKKFVYETDEFTIEFTPTVNLNLNKEFVKENVGKMTEEEKVLLRQVWELASPAKFKALQAKVSEKDYKGKRNLLIFDAINSKPGAPNWI